MSSSSSEFLHPDSSTSTLPSPGRCPTCGCRGNPNKTTRNLVVCIDGTANKFGRNNTNVVKLFEAVDCDTKDPLPEQYTYYSSGIGTRPRILDVFHRIQRTISDKLDMAIAWNVEEIVKDTYAWLAGKYQEGDQIYLFGFSRGAYQVRILAAMIYEVGFHTDPSVLLILLTLNGSAYDHFESILSHKPNANDMAREFKLAFSWKDARVHFIGVWDTVSSVGLGRDDVGLSASSAAAHACHIRHALALDECRVKFIPEYFLEMNSPDLHNPTQHTEPESRGVEASNENELGRADGPEAVIDHSNSPTSEGSWNASNDDTVLEDKDGSTPQKAQPALASTMPRTQPTSDDYTDRRPANIKEVWFAGSHSDVYAHANLLM
ncbi:hypothetical protein OG21DRAFT_1408962 [Imleria badia]|nr:hypothetical protein OG21DRAFT_1408962 [Imleria badia]